MNPLFIATATATIATAAVFTDAVGNDLSNLDSKNTAHVDTATVNTAKEVISDSPASTKPKWLNWITETFDGVFGTRTGESTLTPAEQQKAALQAVNELSFFPGSIPEHIVATTTNTATDVASATEVNPAVDGVPYKTPLVASTKLETIQNKVVEAEPSIIGKKWAAGSTASLDVPFSLSTASKTPVGAVSTAAINENVAVEITTKVDATADQQHASAPSRTQRLDSTKIGKTTPSVNPSGAMVLPDASNPFVTTSHTLGSTGSKLSADTVSNTDSNPVTLTTSDSEKLGDNVPKFELIPSASTSTAPITGNENKMPPTQKLSSTQRIPAKVYFQSQDGEGGITATGENVKVSHPENSPTSPATSTSNNVNNAELSQSKARKNAAAGSELSSGLTPEGVSPSTTASGATVSLDVPTQSVQPISLIEPSGQSLSFESNLPNVGTGSSASQSGSQAVDALYLSKLKTASKFGKHNLIVSAVVFAAIAGIAVSVPLGVKHRRNKKNAAATGK